MILFSARLFGLTIFVFTIINTLSFSQTSDKQSSILRGENYREELHINTDRDLYIAGEKVWLKIYKLNGLNHTPSNMSKVVYIDLLDIDNNPVSQQKIGIDGYSGSGNFNLPDTLKTGNYILRSYTSWMQNFSLDLFAYKRISVINPFENINSIKIPAPDQLTDSVIFSPEGGHLISGIETRLGFRRINKNGDPVIMNGALIYENNDTLSYVSTENNGYGWTSIKPSGNNKILLVTKNRNGAVKTFSLPEILNDGIALSVSKESENSPILVKIRKSQNYSGEGKNLNLVLQSADLYSIRKEFHFEAGHEIDLFRKDFPDGLSHLVITDSTEKQLADRWIYNESENPITYNVNIQNNTLLPREKIKIEITASDNNGAPVESDFSISVVKKVTSNAKNFNNKKYRQLPELATISTEQNMADINDYLIFNSSHDPFLKQEGNNDEYNPVYIPELEGHLISGNIKYRKSGEPLINKNITLSYVGKVALCQFAKTDKNGNFIFMTREHGLREIVIQPLSSEQKDCYVELYNPFNTTFNHYNHALFYIDSSKIGEINNAIISMQINSIYAPFMQKTILTDPAKEKPNFYGKPDNTILMSKFIELTSLKEVVKELIPNVSTYKHNDKVNFKMMNRNYSNPFETSPLVLVDGVPVYDNEKVLNINSRDIEKIDVLVAKYFITDNVLDGILHFISKKGNLGVMDLDRSVFRQEYDLLQDHNTFYSPDYSTDSLKNNRIPDFRNTLYWNPDLHTDKDGKASIEFYSSDESAQYTITVEGITPDGKTGVTTIPLITKSR
jgi:hypothetical protein